MDNNNTVIRELDDSIVDLAQKLKLAVEVGDENVVKLLRAKYRKSLEHMYANIGEEDLNKET